MYLFKVKSTPLLLITNSIGWIGVIRKEARGLNGADRKEFQEVQQEFIITKAGIIDKDATLFQKV